LNIPLGAGETDPEEARRPAVDVKVMAWETAFSAKTTADPSAMIVWGTFGQRDSEGNSPQGIILLDAFAARLDFPALKMKAVEMQELWRPDYLLIENKGTGMPLIQELLRAGIFAQEANPHRGSDKHMRTNAVADLFKSGLVWAPLGLRWVEQVRDEMAAFPHGENDDLHDAAVYGLLRIRQGALMRLSTDFEAEYQPRRPMEYY
jgi:predicted phage terminase large subunit-like protein